MKMNLMTPINQLGYGVVGINILKALQAEIDVSLHVIGQPQVTNEDDASAVRMGLEAAKTFDSHAPCVKIWHQNQMAEFVGKGEHIAINYLFAHNGLKALSTKHTVGVSRIRRFA